MGTSWSPLCGLKGVKPPVKFGEIELCVEPAGLCGRCTGVAVPLRVARGVRPRLEGKPRTLLSFRVATGTSWSPLCGLNGVKPPVKFGERTWDCSPGHAGKDGPHLAMTEGSCGFSRTAAPGKSGLHARGEGERVLALESREGTTLGARPELHRHRGWLGHPPPLWLLDSLES